MSTTLRDSVTSVVNTFIQAGRTFSVFDVTSEIRNQANSGTLEIPECEVFGRSYRFEIDHGEVKQVFNDLNANNEFSESLSQSFNRAGGYFLYSATPASVSTSTPISTTSTGASAPTSGAGVYQVAKTPVVKLDRTTVLARVKTYLANCSTRGIMPTLKQIQGAIKRDRSTGWSKDEIADIQKEVISQ